MNGGVFHHYPSSKTTHYIAKNLPDVKIKALKGNETLVHPKWIVESLSAGRLLDYKKYLLYTGQSSSQPKINFSKGQALDAKSDKFLSEFYNNSRLHLISTMASDFKKYVSDLRSEKPEPWQFPDRLNLPRSTKEVLPQEKTIMHVDMDCFFVSVSLRKHPEHQGKPVAVTHAKGSDSSYSEIASCSYEARARGVKNGMFLGPALKVCPELQTIPYDFEGYKAVAKTLYNTVAKYTLQIQAVSCDEMLVDVSSVLQDAKVDAFEFAEVLRAEIHSATSCSASVGMGPNALLARMATKKAKPNGVFKLAAEEAEDYLRPHGVSTLPGVGRKTAKRLKEKYDIENCGDLQQLSLEELKREFGDKTGKSLFSSCRGIDDGSSELTFDQERKSVSSEINYGIRFTNMSECDNFMTQLAEEVSRRLNQISPDVKARLLTLKLMVRAASEPQETVKFMGHGICDSFSKSFSFNSPTNDHQIITKEAINVLKSFIQANDIRVEDLRGIGIQLSKFETATKSQGNILNFINKPSTSSSNAHQKTASQDLSMSQIDQSVFEQLPEDIRREIEAEMKVGSSASKPHSAPKPQVPAESTKDKNYDNLSFSQIDPSFLEALPLDLQDEIKQQLDKSTKTSNTAFERLMTNARLSPLKTSDSSSPKRQGKRRGRPPKNSPRYIKKSKKPEIQKPAQEVQRSLFQEEQHEASTTQSPPAPEMPKANLDGHRTIEELRPLYVAWVASTDTPTEDDVATLTDFFNDVIKENDLDVVYSSLKTLRRICLSTNSPKWSETYNFVVEKVQQQMLRIHGKTMFVGF